MSGVDITKVFDFGALAHAAADVVLPKDMQWMSGVLGATIDLQCGNPLGALKEGLDVVSDLKDTSLAQKKPAGAFVPPGGWSYEPSPPPPTQWRSPSQLRAAPPTAGSTTTVTTTATTTVTTTGPSQDPGVVAKAEARATAYFQNMAPVPSTPVPPAATPAPSAWRGTPAAPTSLAQIATTPWRLLPSVQDPSTMSKDQFMAQGDEAFMKAVRDGKIPKEISDSPAAMQAMQARMNQISEMNQLMTSMIQAMHQMQMAVIQNVRV
jgi:hypothetical protein